MTAIDPVVDNTTAAAGKTLAAGLASEPGFFTDLLGSMGKAAAPNGAGQVVEIGRQGATAAAGKRKKGGPAVAIADPTAQAVAELGSRGNTKATVAAAEKELASPQSRPATSREPGSKGAAAKASENAHVNDLGRKNGTDSTAGPKSSGPAVKGSEAVGGPAEIPIAAQHLDATAKKPAISGQSLMSGSSQAAARLTRQPFTLERAQLAPGRANVRPIPAHQASARAESNTKSQTPKPPAARDPEENVATQVGRGFAAILRQNGGSLTLRLQPEALGELTIRMDLQPGQVTAAFEVETEQARQLLGTHMSALRSALEARGLGVDALTVQVSERPAQDAPAWTPSEHGANRGGAEDFGGGAAEHRGHGYAGTDDPPAEAGTRSVDQSWPEAGAVGVETGGAQVIRLALDAIA